MPLRRALVLGGGELAEAMAEDLGRTRDLSVTLAEAADVSEFDVVLSAVPPERAAATLRGLIEAKCLVADAGARVEDALPLDGLAAAKQVAACVGCGSLELARLLAGPGPSIEHIDVRVAALMTTALARRLLTGDFRPHWGIWTPERLVARVGMAHGIRQDLRERGVELR